MKRMVFSSVFEADFAEITAQLTVVASLEVSVRWEKAIIRQTSLLRKFPELGRIRRDLHPPGIRTIRVKEYPNYLVFYRLTSTEIIFLRIRYGGTDLTKLFPEE